MELSNYELVRYPSGQLVLLRSGLNAQGVPLAGPRDVVAAFTNESDAQRALERHTCATRGGSAFAMHGRRRG
jgi:hypothetical protein